MHGTAGIPGDNFRVLNLSDPVHLPQNIILPVLYQNPVLRVLHSRLRPVLHILPDLFQRHIAVPSVPGLRNLQISRMFFLDKFRKRLFFCQIVYIFRSTCPPAGYVRSLFPISLLPYIFICGASAGCRKVIGLHRAVSIEHDLPGCRLYRLIRRLLAVNMIVDLIRDAVIHMCLILRICIFPHLPYRIRPCTDRLRLQSLLRIGGRHLAGHHPAQIFLQRHLIDDHPAFFFFIVDQFPRIVPGQLLLPVPDAAVLCQNQHADSGVRPRHLPYLLRRHCIFLILFGNHQLFSFHRRLFFRLPPALRHNQQDQKSQKHHKKHRLLLQSLSIHPIPPQILLPLKNGYCKSLAIPGIFHFPKCRSLYFDA